MILSLLVVPAIILVGLSLAIAGVIGTAYHKDGHDPETE